jgi:hypothetical protein
MVRHIVVMKLMCSLDHCEFDDHTLHKLKSAASHCQLTNPMRQCSWILRKVSSDWLPGYIKATLSGSRDTQNGLILSGQPSHVRRLVCE